MKIEFRRFRPEDGAAIERLNERLAAAGLPHRVGHEPAGTLDATLDDRPILERLFVAADASEIRGAVWLKEQRFWSSGETVEVGWVIYPVSESLVDPRYAGIPAGMIHGLLRLQPRLMALGMGGHGGPFARLLAGARWAQSIVPLQFRMVRPARVLRRLAAARSSRWRRMLADGLGYTGLASAGNALFTRSLSALAVGVGRDLSVDEVAQFGAWTDAIWQRCRDAYAFVAVRDAAAMEAVFPVDFEPARRLRVSRSDEALGWVCTQAHHAAGGWLEEQFGDLRVGIITDAFGAPTDAVALMKVGVRQLLDEGVDLILTNQLHPAWRAAAARMAFLYGPSNLAFYRSPAAEKLVLSGAAETLHAHVTRSDGDGPERQ